MENGERNMEHELSELNVLGERSVYCCDRRPLSSTADPYMKVICGQASILKVHVVITYLSTNRYMY